MKLIITVKKELDMIEQIFKDMKSDGIIKRVQIKTFRSIYMSRLNTFFNLLRFRVRSWIQQENDDQIIAVEEGSKEYIQTQLKDFVNFMQSNTIDTPEIKQYQDDRLIRKILRGMGNYKTGLANKVLKSHNPQQFFNSIGITINWKTEEDTTK